MKLLLDENLPNRLKADFPDHEVATVRDMGWQGVKNGPLLLLMIENGFQAFLTFDKNLQHQQNFKTYEKVLPGYSHAMRCFFAFFCATGLLERHLPGII